LSGSARSFFQSSNPAVGTKNIKVLTLLHKFTGWLFFELVGKR
jgi:hypothetical protein